MTKTISDQEPTYFMTGTAHCADLYPPRDKDVVDLKNARTHQFALLQQWIAE